MSVLALHHHPDERELHRYGAAAIAIVLLHVALIAAALFWYQRPEPAGVSMQPILVDLAPPASAAQQIETQDLAPGPVVQEAEAPPPEPPKTEMVEEQLLPTPPQPEPVVAAPLKVEPKPEPTPVKPQPVREKKPIKKQLVERSTAAKAERIAPESPALNSGASAAAAAAASYGKILSAHLQRFKQYPSSARERGEQGTSVLSFTMTRSGRVTSSRLAKSSGHASLDQETLALIQRAQPLPPFPPEMREASKGFTQPFSFTAR